MYTMIHALSVEIFANVANAKVDHMSRKGKGIAFERTVKKYLKEQGCLVVRQAASFFPDIIAVTPNSGKVVVGNTTFHGRFVLAVECKARDGKLSKHEREVLIGLEKKYGTLPYFAKRGKTLKDIVWERVDEFRAL
jgi:Holliday junction resolvase